MKASYLSLSQDELHVRVEELRGKLADCDLCPMDCRVDRLAEEKRRCNSGDSLLIGSSTPHFGEERPLVGRSGSGTIFLANCNMKCVFCQNYELSQRGQGSETTPTEAADLMLELQSRGCNNVNWVSPTHFVPQLVESLSIAIEKGLEIPIVYNTGGYDKPETLKLLDGIVDIYMPDMKYSDNEAGKRYSGAPGYWEVNKKAVKEMYRQVGDLEVDNSGIARQGLLIRHLVLPEGLAGTEKVLEFIGNEISRNSYVNVMDQYKPCWHAYKYEQLDRPITGKEYQNAIDTARRLGLDRGL